jgi:transcriptional regulator with XRE-family HTH domain
LGPFNYSRVDLARRRRGLTKNALAEAADISTRSLLKYEREGQEPTPITLQRLADALSFPVEFFHGETLDSTDTGDHEDDRRRTRPTPSALLSSCRQTASGRESPQERD